MYSIAELSVKRNFLRVLKCVTHVFCHRSIMLYLADKFQRFIPRDQTHRAQTLNWVFWQMAGQGPMTGV